MAGHDDQAYSSAEVKVIREMLDEKPVEPAQEWRCIHAGLGDSLITTDESRARNAAIMYGAQLQSRTPATASQSAGEWIDEL